MDYSAVEVSAETIVARSVGLPWMPSLKSGILAGVGEIAALIAVTIANVHWRRGPAARAIPGGTPAAAPPTA
jgi:hypothetical protein